MAQSFICFILPVYCFQTFGKLTTGGVIYALYDFQTYFMIVLVFVASMKVFSFNGAINKFLILVTLGCVANSMLFIWIFGKIKLFRNYGSFDMILVDPFASVLCFVILMSTVYIEFMLTYI